MPNVTLSISQDGLDRFDKWRNGFKRPLPRGEAIIELLDLVASRGEYSMDGRTKPPSTIEGVSAAVQVDLKALRLATGKAVLGAVEADQGVSPVAVVGDELSKQPVRTEAVKPYDDWELPGAPELENGPPERVLDRSGDQSTDYDFDQTPGRRRR